MHNQKPINLDLTKLKYPPMAIVSILHRISGILLFVLMPLMIYFLNLSLISEQSFENLKIMLAQPIYKVSLWAFSAALIYHLLAGIRHLIMDLGYGESLYTGKRSAVMVIFLSAVAIIFLGIWIW